MTMAPATESVMGSLPREKAGVGSAVNDTTRQMGGALGVAIIGSVVSSVYAADVADVAGSSASPARPRTGPGVARRGARGRPGLPTASPAATSLRRQGRLRRRAQQRAAPERPVILVAAFVAWRFLPARAHDPLVDRRRDDGRRQHHDGDAVVAARSAGD